VRAARLDLYREFAALSSSSLEKPPECFATEDTGIALIDR
jgi:hypothetical protein